MTKLQLNKLKQAIKNLAKQSAKSFLRFKKQLTSSKSPLNKKNFVNLIKLLAERWRVFSLVLIAFISIYYGLGAAISSEIKNHLNQELKITAPTQKHLPSAIIHVLKTQIVDSPWTPSLPAIFPASILDNMPSFQKGAKDSANFFIKKLAARHADKNLKEASQLLDYPSDIWLFSRIKEDKLAPGSAKQYRKAIDKIAEFNTAPAVPAITPTQDFLYFTKAVISRLNRHISHLGKHIREHNAELLDFKADDIFYQTQGEIYTLHYILSALAKDYKEEVIKAEQYENITAALSFLELAEMLDPLAVKNASPNDVFEANHLLYLAYYLSEAQSRLKTVYYKTKLKSMKANP
ncbi:MAG: DUF2333 family protein [Alphaproteobacteria bacterium]|nr:DUF2333 family protein [Alphaproteobacteria bacterium]